MTDIKDLLIKQTQSSIDWINKLCKDLPDEAWVNSPEILNTSIAWQIGHLSLSQYYYLIVLLNSPKPEVAEKFSLKNIPSYLQKEFPKKK